MALDMKYLRGDLIAASVSWKYHCRRDEGELKGFL
jgi:hypothetical protein